MSRILTDDERDTVQAWINGIAAGRWNPTPATKLKLADILCRLLLRLDLCLRAGVQVLRSLPCSRQRDPPWRPDHGQRGDEEAAMSDRTIEIPAAVIQGCALAGLDAHDVAQLAMGAAAWAAGVPIAENENLPTFQATVNRVMAAYGMHFDFDEFKANL